MGRVIKNNPKLFFASALLAVFVAIINFNIGVSFKDAFIEHEQTLTNAVIEKMEDEEPSAKEITKSQIISLTEAEYQKIIREKRKDLEKIERVRDNIKSARELTGNGTIVKKEAKQIIEKKGESSRTV